MSDPQVPTPSPDGDLTNTVSGQAPVLPKGANTSTQGTLGGTGGASTSQNLRNENGEESSDDDSYYDDARSTRSGRHNSQREFTQIPFDYSRLIFNDSSWSLHGGKIPQFDGVSYSKWKNSMEEYLMAVNPTLWTIVNRGVTFS